MSDVKEKVINALTILMKRETVFCDCCEDIIEIKDLTPRESRTPRESLFMGLFNKKDLCQRCLKNVKVELKSFGLDMDIDI